MKVRITLTFDEDNFRLLRWVLQQTVRLHACAPGDIQVTVEADRG